jgi:16S rRNA (adenine1518-N6/adenine1519-N6)-dimethyltransferase
VSARSRRQTLGQHFLGDVGVARAIVDTIAPRSTDLVIEIGPGRGALTGELARRAGHVIALEIDSNLVPALRTRFPSVVVVQADARSWPYASLVRPPGGRVMVVGNLPYSVGTAILTALIAARSAIDEMVIMLQREVAERVAAAPGSKSYGSLSVLTQLVSEPTVVLRIPPGAFRPPPKVESALLRVRILAVPRVCVPDEERFRAVVRAAFAQRRKTIANSLATALALPSEQVRDALETAGIDAARRAETLSLEEFAHLTARLSESIIAPSRIPGRSPA